jgi:DNA-binding XRE family transcriptional regulator
MEQNLTKNMRSAENIRSYRTRLKLTQEQLAEMIGVHRKTIGKWENGTDLPSDENKQKLEQLFFTGKIEQDQIYLDPERNALLFSKINFIGLGGITLGAIAILAMIYLVFG